jgi:hypothetical protein
MKPKTLLTLAAILAFVGLLAYSTLSAQKVTCNVCVEFNGSRNCAKASANSETDAARAAQTTACGPVASGMDQAIACDNRPAVSKSCSTQ